MRDLFLKDWSWKLFSLALAVGIWLTVHRILQEASTPVTPGSSSTLTYENLPVLIVSSAADVSLYHVAPTVVKVTVSGPAEVMNKLQASQVRAMVDLTDIAPTSDLNRQVNIFAPPNVTLIRVEPPSVTIIPPAAKH
jgi:YbbR domain-containing protein